jgi:3-dehydroquinate synthase
MKTVTAVAPVRADLSGGFTDVDQYRNANIAKHISVATGWTIKVTLVELNQPKVVLRDVTSKSELTYDTVSEITDELNILRAALQDFGIHSGIKVITHATAPRGAGLGTSGALAVALVAALSEYTNSPPLSRQELAFKAFEIERVAGNFGGLQDQFGAAIGGWNLFTFFQDSYSVHPVEYSESALQRLQESLFVIYPGGQRISSGIVEDVMAAYEGSDEDVTHALAMLNFLAEILALKIKDERIEEIPEILQQVCQYQGKLNSRIVAGRNREIIDDLRAQGIVGVKVLGGGGANTCLLAMVPEIQHQAVLQQYCLDQGVKLMPVEISTDGVRLEGALERQEVKMSFTKKSEKTTQIRIAPGLLGGDWVQELPMGARHFVVTDTTVGALYLDKVVENLIQAGHDIYTITVPEGEHSKTLKVYGEVGGEMTANGLTKNSTIISLGGGVINNLAGYLAATLYRGVSLVHLPTSFLSQIDATIDTKQAVNGPNGKNHYGSYYSPELVVVDPDVLLSQDRRHWANGLSEAIKHALTQDIALFELIDRADGIDDLMQNHLVEVVERTIALKVELLNMPVEQFEFSEMLPQYGHSIGHAVEILSKYQLLHGEAISIGMCISAEIGMLLGYCDEHVVQEHYRIFEKFGLPTTFPTEILTQEALLEMLTHDKHYSWGFTHSVLVNKIGGVMDVNDQFVFSLSNEIVLQGVAKNLQRQLVAV